MTKLADDWVVPWLAFLAEWSVRWGLVLAVLAIWLALRPPRRAAIRHLLCAVGLAVGVLLPFTPRWWVATVPWPYGRGDVTARSNTGSPVARIDARDSGIPLARDARSIGQFPKSIADPPARTAAPWNNSGLPRRDAVSAWRTAAIGIAAAWLFVVIALCFRLIGGRLMLGRLRSTALRSSEDSDQLLDECRRSLRLSRPVALAVHSAVGSPVAIGGRRALIIVPTHWDDWSEPHRRACLLHELTHLARRDDWVKHIQEVVRVPFFFHPLVRWLLNRLDRERELLCDENVVVLGADPLGYARLLLEVARRPGRLLPTSVAARVGCLPFFDRRTVAVRIEHLLEDDVMRSLTPLPARRLIVLGTVAFAAAIGVGGLRVRAVEPRPKLDDPVAPQAVKVAPSPAATRKIEGLIRDPDGKAVADAIVVAGFVDSAQPGHQIFKTNKYGRFAWWVPESPETVYFVAHKEGLAPVTWIRWMRADLPGDQVERSLARPEPFSAVLVDDAGRPVAGARVRMEAFAFGSASPPDNDGGQSATISFCNLFRHIIGGSPIEGAFETTTDLKGAFTLRSAPGKAWLKLAVTTTDGREFRLRAADKGNGMIASQMAGSGFVAALPGRSTRLVVLPAARIVGRVVTKITGLSVAGLRVWFQGSHPDGADWRDANGGDRHGVTDDDGRFAIDRLNDGTVNVLVDGPGEGERWTYRAAQDVALKSGVTSDVTIELIPGVDVAGQVVFQGTGKPVEGVHVGVYGPFRPHSGAATKNVSTDAQGRFRYRLPTGETYLYVMGSASNFITLPDNGSSRTFTVPEGFATFEAPTLEVRSAVVLHGRVVDATGEAVAHVTLVGVSRTGKGEFPKGATPAGVTNDRGEFRLSLQNHSAPPGEQSMILVRLRDGREFTLPITPAADGEVTVKLPNEP